MVYLHVDEWSMWVWDFKCIQLYRFDVDGYVTRKCDHYNTIKGDIKEHCAKYFFSFMNVGLVSSLLYTFWYTFRQLLEKDMTQMKV